MRASPAHTRLIGWFAIAAILLASLTLVFLLVSSSTQSPTIGAVSGVGAWVATKLVRAGVELHLGGAR